MVLEISSIQDVKLQEIANKVDKKGNENGKIDNDEIGQLLTQMTKNKYEFQDFKNLLGADFENLSNEEKLNVYQNCHDELKESLQLAETTVVQTEEKKAKGEDDFLKITGIFAAIGAAMKGVSGAFSLKNMLRGGAIGAAIGMLASCVAIVGDNALYENSKEKCNIKNDTMKTLEDEINKLKEA